VQRRSLSPYINVTPLVDVVLVLLIIFMVLTPKMLEKFQVKLPAVFHPDPKAKMSYEPVCVIITADGYSVLQKAKLLGFKGTGLVVGHKHKHKEQG